MKKSIISFLASHRIVIAICTFFSKRINAIIKEKDVTDRINNERKLISKYNKVFDQKLVLNGPFNKIVKAREFNFQELSKMSYEEQMTVLEEKRPGYMEWMYLSPLSSGQHK